MSIEGNPANTGNEANGTPAERQFDSLLRLTNLVNRADAGVLSSFALTLDDADQRTQVIREDGKVYAYGYDAIGQLTNAAASLADGTPWSGYQYAYDFDATGNPVEQNKNGLVHSNSFNNLNQNAETRFAGGLAAIGTYASPLAATVTVNQVQAQLHEGAWAAAGIPFIQGTNILTRTIQDLAGRSASATSTVVVADRTHAYDANGNMTTNGVFTYVWDCENRLTEVWKNGSLVQSNRYDALWRRREKIDYAADGTATTNRYIYKDWLVLAITDASGALLETYTHGADLSGQVGGDAGGIGGILASTQAGGVAVYAYDFNGNIVGVTSSNQSVLATLTYTPFGEVLARTGSFTPRYQFSTKEYSPRTGLNYYGYRYYAPRLGRWMNRDPIGELGTIDISIFMRNAHWCRNILDSKVECKIDKMFNALHPVEVCYAYCGNNCLNCLDYLGLKTSLEQLISDSLYCVPCEEILSFIKCLEATRDELEKRIDSASDFEELTKGFVQIGQNWIFSGSVTDAGKQTLSKWQKKIINYVEKDREFNNMNSEHPLPLLYHGQKRQYAHDWGEAEANRMSAFITILRNAYKEHCENDQ